MVDCYIIAHVCWLVLWSEVGPTTALKEGTGGGLLGLGGEGECGGWASLSSPNPYGGGIPHTSRPYTGGVHALVGSSGHKSTKKGRKWWTAPLVHHRRGRIGAVGG